MENQESNNESVEDTQSGGDASQDVTEGATAQSEASNEQEGTEKATPEPETESADKVDFTKDSEGKEWIPKDAFEKRIGSVTAKYKEAQELLEALKTNPEVRKKFLGSEETTKESVEEPEETVQEQPEVEYQPEEVLKPINDWLNQLSSSPEHQAFYRNQIQSILKTIDMSVTPFVMKTIKAEIAKAVTPISRSIGEISLKDFSKANPDFSRYQPQVYKIMKETGLGVEQAYQLAKYPDLEKSLSKQTQKQPQAPKKPDLKKVPIGGRQTSQTSKLSSNKMSLYDAVREAAKETGW